MALFYVVWVIFCSVVRADAASDLRKYWGQAECAALTVKGKDDCTEVGWCVWVEAAGSGSCVRDLCLDTIADNVNTCGAGPSGVTCTAFYFTNRTECNGNIAHTDKFCQATEQISPIVVVPSYFDWCFYKTLELSDYVPGSADGSTPANGEWKISENLCEWKNVTLADSIGVKQYSVQKDEVQDCSGLIKESGVNEEYCNCLGAGNCPLIPYCYVTGSGSSAKCVYDDCTTDYNTDCNQNTKCWRRSMNVKDPTDSTLQRRTLCVNKARKDNNPSTNLPNECYLLQDVTSDCGSNSQERCETGVLFDDNLSSTEQGGPLLGDKAGSCSWVPIAPGIIPASYYCTDTRSVPSPESGSVIVHVSSFLLLLMALIFFY